MTVVIPGLPKSLATVPPSPLTPTDPLRFEKSERWFQWREEVIRYRVKRRLYLEQNPDKIPIEMAICAQSFDYWLAMWCFIYEPRDGDSQGEMSLNGIAYWIPFDRQLEMAHALEDAMVATGAEANFVCSKAREVGASWLICAYNLWKFLYAPIWTSLLLSRKEEYVESSDPQSLFWKIMFLWDNLPAWMIPAGFKRRVHKTKLRLRHPTKHNYIIGESTNTNAGRGNRVTAAFIDEAAFVENFEQVWAGLINSTRHACAISSESIETSMGFYNLRSRAVSPSPTIFEFDWWQCPYHLDDWLAGIRERFALEPFRFNQEVLRDPKAGNKSFIYTGLENKQPSEHFFFVRHGGAFHCGVDPGMKDMFAFVWGQDNRLTGKFVILDSYENNGQEARFYVPLLRGEFIEGMNFAYGERELELMEQIQQWGVLPKFSGDVYGKNKMGSSNQSVYDVWMQNGIYVNIDRTPQDQATAHLLASRTKGGRREAVRQLIPRLEFADTPGARWVKWCMENYRYAPINENSTVLSDEPIKNQAVHICAALEYLAVGIRNDHLYGLASLQRAGDEQGSLNQGLVYLT